MNSIDWGEIYKELSAYIESKVDVDQVAADITNYIVDKYEEYTQDMNVAQALNAVWQEVKGDGLSFTEVKAIVVKYILNSTVNDN